jgi:hypothetical protein
MRPYLKGGYNSLDLSPPTVQRYLIKLLTAFMQKTGAGGFAWDHGINTDHAGPERLVYAQWRAWMNILGALRTSFPELVMDHRQSAHQFGPWYQLAGSYSEPIAGDENPETYGVPVASLHADQVAADNTRIINYVYSTQQLLPQSRIPGFVFHQTERTSDNNTNVCFGGVRQCYNTNTRDFDYLAYQYSVC